jgi:hypothetical protein
MLETDDLVHKSVFGNPNIADEVEDDIAWADSSGFHHGYEETVWAPTGVERDTLVKVEKYDDADYWPGDAREDDTFQSYVSGSLQRGGD